MSSPIIKGNHPISQDIRNLISKRYKNITRAINRVFWNSDSEITHSRYVGSYGRGTAINTSDLDVLFELPGEEYSHFTSLLGNGPSRLLQAVKDAVLDTYSRTEIKGDGQVVVVNFSDGMKFEILPAFQNNNPYTGNRTYIYPDTHMGGNWMTTDPKSEQDAMKIKNDYWESNGLLFDTCKHIRFIKSESFSSYHLSGILIDSFTYVAIQEWHWLRSDEQGNNNLVSYEQALLDYYDQLNCPIILAPGSNKIVDTDDWEILGKILRKMV